MTIEFELPESIVNQTGMTKMLAEQVMRSISRRYDESEHDRPWEYINVIWPFIQQIESADLKRSMARNGSANGSFNGSKNGSGHDDAPAAEKKKPSTGNLRMVHMIEALSWGDAGIYLSTPASALGGAAIHAVGTPDQKKRFLERFTQGEPKWGAMAMTEPQAGSDTSNIKTTAALDPETNEWILNGEKIFVTNGSLAGKESDGLIVVWATLDRSAGRAGMRPFVVESGTPGMTITKLEEKMGIRASDTAAIVFTDCRIPFDNILGNPELVDPDEAGAKGFKGAMKTFDASRPYVAASAVGIARAAFEFTRDTLADQGIKIPECAPLHQLSAIQRDLLQMEVDLKAAWLLTIRSVALLDAGESNNLEASMAKVKAGHVVTTITQKCVELLGPLGYSHDFLVEKWMRDAKINDIFEGTGQINTLIVARRILGYTRNELK
ncbi:MAG: acyl-CoA dehydrogenase family protein [Caldilineales bacterium]|nr:acyl-CoA dehydrogenase family protein [Caldilineales bacterium]